MFGEYQLHRHTTQTTWGREKKTQFGTCVRVCTSTHLLELHCTCTRRHFLSFLTNANARDNNAWRPGERTSSRQSVDPVIGLRLVFLTATLGKEKKTITREESVHPSRKHRVLRIAAHAAAPRQHGSLYKVDYVQAPPPSETEKHSSQKQC